MTSRNRLELTDTVKGYLRRTKEGCSIEGCSMFVYSTMVHWETMSFLHHKSNMFSGMNTYSSHKGAADGSGRCVSPLGLSHDIHRWRPKELYLYSTLVSPGALRCILVREW